MTVKWKGPQGEIDEDSNESLIRIIYHPGLKDIFHKQDLNEALGIAISGLDFLRALYASKKLSSRYHNLGHNYVTAITSIKAFIGALNLSRELSVDDLTAIILAALFHDCGYLTDKDGEPRIDMVDHTAKSSIFAEVFLTRNSFKKVFCDRVYELIGYTNYSNWYESKVKVRDDLLGQMLVGADLLQVTDQRYFLNKKVLKELLYKKDSATVAEREKKFYEFTKEVTSQIWKFLDSYYRSSNDNPYRQGWERFVDAMSVICGGIDLK
ncbi:MAG: hypothetical protein PHS44_05790 [Candidatus Dojkabacteria bacterium]|nr:hypothetical protein [Candidatus Dojkabacteria bacterium]